MLDNVNIIFESYNSVIQDGFDRLFSELDTNKILEMDEGQIYALLSGEIERWENTPIAALDGQSPEKALEQVETKEALSSLFDTGCRVCDRELPGLLTRRIYALGQPGMEMVLSRALDTGKMADEEEMVIPLMAIRTLADWKLTEAIQPLLEVLYQCGENELFHEEIADALSKIGQPSVQPIINTLEKAQHISSKEEFLLGSLVRIGQTHPEEAILAALKNTFRKMENKRLGALYIGDYGDGRGIPLLRSYVERNRASLGKQELYDFLGAIQKLGGQIEDLR